MNYAPLHLAVFEDHYAVVALLSECSSKEIIQRTTAQNPLVSCFEKGNSNYDSLEILLTDGWDPNYISSSSAPQMHYKNQLSVLSHALESNKSDCVDLLLQFGARFDLDQRPAINIPISMWNFDIFDTLLAHGADIHGIDPVIGAFPATIATALSNHRFITRLCQLGLDTSVLFHCPYQNDQHPLYSELKSQKINTSPWCCYIANYTITQKTVNIVNWLMPYLAKFTNHHVKLCSHLSSIMSPEARFEMVSIQKTIPTLKHLARLQGNILKHCKWYIW